MLRVVQVAGLPLLFVPLTLVAYVGLPPEKSNSIAGLLNFMRNIGSSVGTSMVTTLVARQAQLHQVHLVAHTTPADPSFTEAVVGLAARLAASGVAASQADAAYAALSCHDRSGDDARLHRHVSHSSRLAPRSWCRCPLRCSRNDPGGGGTVMESA